MHYGLDDNHTLARLDKNIVTDVSMALDNASILLKMWSSICFFFHSNDPFICFSPQGSFVCSPLWAGGDKNTPMVSSACRRRRLKED
jgi:hypothetical protein